MAQNSKDSDLISEVFSRPCQKELRQGCEAFNSGRYWDAHEHWERAWKSLVKGPSKLAIQACIQVAAAVHLLDLGRKDASFRMMRLALKKGLEIQKSQVGIFPIQILPDPFLHFDPDRLNALDSAESPLFIEWIAVLRKSKAKVSG